MAVTKTKLTFVVYELIFASKLQKPSRFLASKLQKLSWFLASSNINQAGF